MGSFILIFILAAAPAALAGRLWVAKAPPTYRQPGWRYLGPVDGLEGYQMYEKEPNRENTKRLEVEWAEEQIPVQRQKRTPATLLKRHPTPPGQREAASLDPLWAQQWHMQADWLNASHAWLDQNITGRGVVIAIVDDGLEHTHADLSARYVPEHSRDFNHDRPDPAPGPEDAHGTAAAGVAGATKDNGHCGAGMAPEVGLAGLRLISEPTTDLQEALALGYHGQDIHVYSCSWGPTDDGKALNNMGHLVQAQMKRAIANGRGGKGSIYVWAAGNGRENHDRADYDGYANSPYTIAVGAVDHTGTPAYYSEPGACLFISMPSNGAPRYGITTVDLSGPGLGYDASSECTATFGGTSAAAPMAAGLIALILEARPDLTWRDVQGVLARAASKGMPHSHDTGFGVPSVPETLRVARNWTLWPPQLGVTSNVVNIENGGLAIPGNGTALCYTYTLTSPPGTSISFIEHVQLHIGITHLLRGELDVWLTSPASNGRASVFALAHAEDRHAHYRVDAWVFTSVHHWGESMVNGDWAICMRDTVNNAVNGRFTAFKLGVYGH
jgi:subtilisin family serine protease/subtilisin-like proprotein convertase family protein